MARKRTPPKGTILVAGTSSTSSSSDDGVQKALTVLGARLDALEADLARFKRDVRESVTIRSRDDD